MADYTNKTLLYAKFSQQNIDLWADLENEGTDTVQIDARIDAETAWVTEAINNELRLIYTALPLDAFDSSGESVAADIANVPLEIQDIATAWVGFKLYIARGIQDDNVDPVASVWEEAKKRLARIKSGQVRLDRKQVSRSAV